MGLTGVIGDIERAYYSISCDMPERGKGIGPWTLVQTALCHSTAEAKQQARSIWRRHSHCQGCMVQFQELFPAPQGFKIIWEGKKLRSYQAEGDPHRSCRIAGPQSFRMRQEVCLELLQITVSTVGHTRRSLYSAPDERYPVFERDPHSGSLPLTQVLSRQLCRGE